MLRERDKGGNFTVDNGGGLTPWNGPVAFIYLTCTIINVLQKLYFVIFTCSCSKIVLNYRNLHYQWKENLFPFCFQQHFFMPGWHQFPPLPIFVFFRLPSRFQDSDSDTDPSSEEGPWSLNLPVPPKRSSLKGKVHQVVFVPEKRTRRIYLKFHHF